jgi:alpha-1,3-rhamnosyl/mannosyltransferase
MRIGLDARYLYDHFPGIGRYIANLIPALSELAYEHDLIVLYNPALPNTRHDLEALRRLPNLALLRTSARPFSPAEQVQIPWLARSLRLDLLHSPYYIKPYAGLACPSVVTIYDLLGRRFPHALPRRSRLLFELAMLLAVRSATRIITISQHSRSDIASAYRIPGERITVTPLAADPQFTPQPAESVAVLHARYGLPPRYILYLGSNKPHKNLERLMHAWKELNERDTAARNQRAEYYLVVAGHYDPRYPAAQQFVVEHGLADRVKFIPNIAEADLPALYSGAEVFVFPSYYEGFGLPPLEAMACGTPVLCAATSSLPEVVGAAALMVDPYSVSAIAAGLGRLLNDAELRGRLRAEGLRRARQFSWRRTAEMTLAVYEAATGW